MGCWWILFPPILSHFSVAPCVLYTLSLVCCVRSLCMDVRRTHIVRSLCEHALCTHIVRTSYAHCFLMISSSKKYPLCGKFLRKNTPYTLKISDFELSLWDFEDYFMIVARQEKSRFALFLDQMVVF